MILSAILILDTWLVSQCRWRRWAYLSQVCSLATRGSYTPHNRLKWWNPHLFKTGLNHSQNRVKSFSILLFFSSVEMQYYDILSTINLYMLWLQCRSVYSYEVEWQQNMREKKILLVRSLVCVIRERERDCHCDHPEQPLHPQWTHSTILPCGQNEEDGRYTYCSKSCCCSKTVTYTLKFAFWNSTNTGCAKVGVSWLNATQAAQIFIPRLRERNMVAYQQPSKSWT